MSISLAAGFTSTTDLAYVSKLSKVAAKKQLQPPIGASPGELRLWRKQNGLLSEDERKADDLEHHKSKSRRCGMRPAECRPSSRLPPSAPPRAALSRVPPSNKAPARHTAAPGRQPAAGTAASRRPPSAPAGRSACAPAPRVDKPRRSTEPLPALPDGECESPLLAALPGA
mmetsp:Transcript_26122/g.77172  ORF Transcript_26122/g.77172 Transcript_26122/m.77172 type:complete len:171 (-) Transcript_26122:247-759(-)